MYVHILIHMIPTLALRKEEMYWGLTVNHCSSGAPMEGSDQYLKRAKTAVSLAVEYGSDSDSVWEQLRKLRNQFCIFVGAQRPVERFPPLQGLIVARMPDYIFAYFQIFSRRCYIGVNPWLVTGQLVSNPLGKLKCPVAVPMPVRTKCCILVPNSWELEHANEYG